MTNQKDCDEDCLSCNTDTYISCEKRINPNTRPDPGRSSELLSPQLRQCETCIFEGRRTCIHHGYPEKVIPNSCSYKIGSFAVIDPVEAQLRNKAHDALIRKDEREKALTDLKTEFLKYVHPDSDAGKVMKTLIKHRITEQP